MGHDMVAPHWEPSCTIHGDDIARSKAGWNLDNGVRSGLEQLQWGGPGFKSLPWKFLRCGLGQVTEGH